MGDGGSDVCKCGHYWHEHSVGAFTTRACRESGCDCKKYRKYAHMSWDDAQEWRKKCSQRSQPTSGTSPSPSPSYSQALIASMYRVPPSLLSSPSESPKKSVLQPETRSMPVVGFRSWLPTTDFKLGIGHSPRLAAMNHQYGRWMPGVNVAECHAKTYSPGAGFFTFSYEPSEPVKHATFETAPDPDCTCGFYVLTDLDKVPWRWTYGSTEQIGFVGAIVGWGRVIQHGDEGWRAEKVQVIALLDAKWSDEHTAKTHELAEAYGVPVLERNALELLAREYGDPLPALVEENVGQ